MMTRWIRATCFLASAALLGGCTKLAMLLEPWPEYGPFKGTASRFPPPELLPDARVGSVRGDVVWTGDELLLFWSTQDGRSGVQAFSPASGWRKLRGRPPARRLSTVVWTGRAAIFWGGAERSGEVQRGLDSGIAYDPRTGRSRPISRRGAPSARWEYTATWTGSEMLVWGYGRERRCDGALYDPQKDSWRAVSTNGAPATCTAFRAFRAGSRVVFSTLSPPAGGIYDPARDSWTAISGKGAPDAWGADPVEGPDGALYGVASPPGDQRLFYYRLDPVENAWSKIALACGVTPHVAFDGRFFLGVNGIPYMEACTFDVVTREYARNAEPAGGLYDTGSFIWTGREALVWSGVVTERFGRWPEETHFDAGVALFGPPPPASVSPGFAPR